MAGLDEAWDGVNLKFTFRRTVDRELWESWEELKQIVSSIHKTDEEDAIIWQFNSSGRYSVQSRYAVINDRGIKQIYTPVMWKIHVPPRIHVFL
jgi:predicted RNA methylase